MVPLPELLSERVTAKKSQGTFSRSVRFSSHSLTVDGVPFASWVSYEGKDLFDFAKETGLEANCRQAKGWLLEPPTALTVRHREGAEGGESGGSEDTGRCSVRSAYLVALVKNPELEKRRF